MCRSIIEGGRRCPGGRGEFRRARQRAAYNLRKLAAEEHVATVHPLLGRENDDGETLVQRTSRTEVAALNALEDFRASGHGGGRYRGEEAAAYTTAVIAHGEALLARVFEDIGGDFSDDPRMGELNEKLDALSKPSAEEESLLDAYKAANAAQRAERSKNGVDSTALNDASVRARDAWWDVQTKRLNESTATRLEMARISRDRGVKVAEAVTALIRATRATGGDVPLAEDAKMTRADKQMLADVASLFPSEMVQRAAERETKLRPRRSKARAHYVSSSRAKKRVKKAAVFDLSDVLANPDNVYGPMRWFIPLGSDALPDESRLDNNKMVPDTPENREKLGRFIDIWCSRYRSRPAGKTPRIAEMIRHTENGPEKRIMLFYPDGDVSTQLSDTVTAELTFNDKSSMVHEFAHHMEYANPEIAAACKSFLYRRTEDCEREVYNRSGRRVEWTKADGFTNRYVGKDYEGTSHTEVFSMGVEALFTGDQGSLLGTDRAGDTVGHRADHEHAALILGLLSVANRSVAAESSKRETNAG